MAVFHGFRNSKYFKVIQGYSKQKNNHFHRVTTQMIPEPEEWPRPGSRRRPGETNTATSVAVFACNRLFGGCVKLEELLAR